MCRAGPTPHRSRCVAMTRSGRTPAAARSSTADRTTTADPPRSIPGYIVSDEVFYNCTGDDVGADPDVRGRRGRSVRRRHLPQEPEGHHSGHPGRPVLRGYTGGIDELGLRGAWPGSSVACGINPQVMLVTLQKESALLTRSAVGAVSYTAAWGWHCPDSGRGGSANCDPIRRLLQPDVRHGQAVGALPDGSGQVPLPAPAETADILWNVAQTGCGGSDVTIRNTATASLYNYTPYQPNASSAGVLPGCGRPLQRLRQPQLLLPVPEVLRRHGWWSERRRSRSTACRSRSPTRRQSPPRSVAQRITAPNEAVARGLAAGFASVGLPYVWGGGTTVAGRPGMLRGAARRRTPAAGPSASTAPA